jgi:hypothetical protein
VFNVASTQCRSFYDNKDRSKKTWEEKRIQPVQGMTLNQACVLLNKSFFASGQAYVALSRVKKLDNLHLLSFCEKAIFLDPFYQDLLKWMNSADVLENNTKLPFPVKLKRVQNDQDTSRTEQDEPVQRKRVRDDAEQCLLMPKVKCRKTKDQDSSRTEQEHLYACKQAMTAKETIPAQPDITKFAQRELGFLNQNQLPQANARIISKIQPAFLKHFQIVDTPAGGNCLFNSLSICLSGTPALSAELRILAASTIQLHEVYFKKIIDEFGVANQTYQDAVRTACVEGAWGGEYHIQALAMALNRPIYVYTSFQRTNGQYFFDSTDEDILLEAFQNDLPGTGQHLVYMPIPNTDNEPLMCFFWEYHYSAIVKRTSTSLTFKPHSNLFTTRIIMR